MAILATPKNYVYRIEKILYRVHSSDIMSVNSHIYLMLLFYI